MGKDIIGHEGDYSHSGEFMKLKGFTGEHFSSSLWIVSGFGWVWG
jgi:hypothetical protein